MAKGKLIGNKIKTLREAKGFSVKELSQKAKISEEQLVTLEESEVLPSVAPLINIAKVLEVHMGMFFNDDNSLGPVVCRKDESDERVNLASAKSKEHQHMNYFSLAKTKSGRHMEPYIINLEACAEKDFIMSSHEGEEFIYVLEGAIVITYGENVYTLFAGDSIYYDSIVEHHVECDCEVGAKVLAVVYSPM